MECKCCVADVIEKMQTFLEKINLNAHQSSANLELAAQFRACQQLLHECQKLMVKHEEMFYEQGRQFGEMCKVYAINAPPDRPSMQTVPWQVGNPSTTITPKGALTRRTIDSIPTVQKKK